jgi:hypothetical protein
VDGLCRAWKGRPVEPLSTTPAKEPRHSISQVFDTPFSWLVSDDRLSILMIALNAAVDYQLSMIDHP